jgi:hypothetical protein
VFLDGVLPVLATVVSAALEDHELAFGGGTGVTFPRSVREAVLGSSQESYSAATQDGEL